MKKPFCITFAGVVGCSKTPISNYLSTKLNLPIYNNDAVRTEVTEDMGKFDIHEHVKRRDKRIAEIMKSRTSFILDASCDRTWLDLKKIFEKHGYQYLIISIDLGKPLLKKLYKAKSYTKSLQKLDKLINDHNNFLEKHTKDIFLHISDKNFPNRLRVCSKKISTWIKNKS